MPSDPSLPPIPAAIIAAGLHPDPSKRPDMGTILDCLGEWKRQREMEGFGKEVAGIAKDVLSDVLSTFKKIRK